MGGQTALSLKEEEIFVHDLIVVSICGFPFYKLDLCLLVKGYLEKTSREVNCFKNNTPGEEWLKHQERFHWMENVPKHSNVQSKRC